VPTISLARNAVNGPPFKSGEVVVADDPSTLPPETVVIKYLPHANLTVVAVEKGKEWGQVQRYRLKGKRAALYFIAEASVKPVTTFPNDPYYSNQWNLTKIQAKESWDITRGGGVTVAVLDTGLATDVIDGIGCVVPGFNEVNLYSVLQD